MLKYEFSHILETLFLSVLMSSSTTKTEKNSIQHCTFDVITPFAKLHFFNA